MLVELSHHSGWKQYDVPAATLEEAAYLAVRQSHTFLTDENHTHEAAERETLFAGQLLKWTSVHIYRGPGAPEYTGPDWAYTDYWLAVTYRAAQPPTLQ